MVASSNRDEMKKLAGTIGGAYSQWMHELSASREKLNKTALRRNSDYLTRHSTKLDEVNVEPAHRHNKGQEKI